MNSSTKTYSAHRAFKFGAALEVLGYLTAVAIAIFCFLAGWLTSGQAAVLTLLMLLSLIVQAWTRFDGGRHPCFFFLCVLTLFQAGRLIAYCAGGVTDLFRVTLMTSYQFDISRDAAASVLLSIALSALCVYAPCRWNYRSFSAPRSGSYGRLLPYLYFLLWLSIPVQLYKNYRYYEYAKEHGGYLVFFIDHGGLASSIPLVVRAISLISLPALVGIFVLERRKKFLRTAAACYFLVTAPVLLTGSRGAIFSLILSLWYLTKMKSGQRARLYALGILAAGLVLSGALIGSFRNENGSSPAFAGPAQFIADQGMSLNVTEVAVAYRRNFSPHIASYLASELQSAFVAGDQTNYVAGKRFSDDVAMFLNPGTYRLGFGSGSAYVAEAYLVGGLWGVALISALLGALLHGMHLCARNPLGLFLGAMILPDVLWMSRGGLLDWVSASMRVGISVLLLLGGWHLYNAIARIGSVLWRSDYAADDTTPDLAAAAARRRMISLIVATIGRVSELERFLTSLENQSHRDFEVIVVDQNPDDRLLPVFNRHAHMAIQHLRSKRGLSRARNAGLRAAKGDIIAIPDDDCWYPDQLLASVAAWFEAHPDFALLSTALRNAGNQTSGPNSPATSRPCTKNNVWRCAISTTLFMRPPVCAAVGEFNENIGVGAASDYQSGEETDYVLRALDHGFHMWYESSLTVYHPPLQSIVRLQKTTYPSALGAGFVLRIHHYPLHQVGMHLIRSLGGAAASLCRGDVARARTYLLRGAGQLVGYISGPRNLNRTAACDGK